MPIWTWFASVALHAAGVGGLGLVAYYHLHHGDPVSVAAGGTYSGAADAVDVQYGEPDGLLFVDREPDPVGDAPHPAGGATVPRIDTEHAGAGGQRTVRAPAVHLSDRDERMRLSPDLVSRLDRDQHQRVRSSAHRSAWEDRRATPRPMELTFLASGDMERTERRAPSSVDPSRGALASPSPRVRGGDIGKRERDEEGDLERTRLGASRPGAASAAPGVGVDDGRPGERHTGAARVARARPDVTLGPVTVPATVSGRPNDDVDSEQEVATTVRSLVHASTAGGLAGEGGGGTFGGGAPGAGAAAGDGSHARPLGVGDGDWFDLNGNDPRLLLYFRRIHKKIDPLWANAFPRSAMIELKQGTVILEFSIAANGAVTVSWPPVRPSGIDEFDRNCADALRRASPLDPIPKELGRASLKIRAPFTANNPVVR